MIGPREALGVRPHFDLCPITPVSAGFRVTTTSKRLPVRDGPMLESHYEIALVMFGPFG